MKKIGILQFPGTNCEKDVHKVFKPSECEFLFYADSIDIQNYKSFIIPGGFSYGDYLRSGALAAHSPAMKDVIKAADKGVPVLGICNGFQILCEARLLKGVLLQNKTGRYIDRWESLSLKNANSFWGGNSIQKTCLPIAHGDGCYYLPQDELKQLWDKQLVWLTYDNNPNGSVGDIAGVMNERGNVVGLMPHPERAMSSQMGGQDGIGYFEIIKGLT